MQYAELLNDIVMNCICGECVLPNGYCDSCSNKTFFAASFPDTKENFQKNPGYLSKAVTAIFKLTTLTHAYKLKFKEVQFFENFAENKFDLTQNISIAFIEEFGQKDCDESIDVSNNKIDLNDIIEFELQLQAINDAKNYVFKYIDKKTQEDIEKMDDNKTEHEAEKTSSVVNSINELEAELKKVLKDVVNKYKVIDLEKSYLNPYASAPPKELFGKLHAAVDLASIYNCKKSWTKIEEDITQKIRLNGSNKSKQNKKEKNEIEKIEDLNVFKPSLKKKKISRMLFRAGIEYKVKNEVERNFK
ncbi:hypothetical protein RFI_25327 [Reticulomyxa filosa]|uniref:Uncharacterized protein n=1 Tax=Reticulomyxa filosa TaxID=46433 RepID=X6MDT9_RETFI|nr:hypothetical protein RFI_25327 [Reticulomyxa filosa]|eukprot:ETO12049.1 hypothetical protein RFI_25327 [Reticulomyxa filosa]